MFYILIIFLKDLKRCKYTIFITFDIFLEAFFLAIKELKFPTPNKEGGK